MIDNGTYIEIASAVSCLFRCAISPELKRLALRLNFTVLFPPASLYLVQSYTVTPACYILTSWLKFTSTHDYTPFGLNALMHHQCSCACSTLETIALDIITIKPRVNASSFSIP